MKPSVLAALEFDRVREALAREASTSLGRARAFALEPAGEPDLVRRRLDLTGEAVALTRRGHDLALDAPEDLDGILAAIGVENEPLVPVALLGLVRFIGSVMARAAAVGAHGGPGLAAIARGVGDFGAECADVTRAIQPSGDVADTASPALREIREALRQRRTALRAALDTLTRGRDTAKYLQDQIVTDRQGRYVLVVRAEHRAALPGIVHGSSASGASLYIEPLATVDLNNDIVALAERERQEVHRILLALTDAFRSREADFASTVAAAADVDELSAKARLAARVDGVAPHLVADGRVEFKGARHPLLIPAVRDLVPGPGDGGRAVVVPSDLTVAPPVRALVISGPNTGGKTVALKAIGLLAVMAQSGLLIPVEDGSAFTPFRSIFTDIGDEQSIAASLSTFSARIANLVAIERDLEPPALVLLDEVGGGTDPVEGGALGAAVIDHFRRRGALVVATTHDDVLKSYAATTEGAAAAAFGFDPDTYAPTYRLMYGVPGRSLALEVAERLGMPPEVVADARRRRTGRESALAAHLASLDRELAALEREKQAAADARASLDRDREALRERETRLAEREAVLKRRFDDRLAEKLREARAEVDAILQRLKTSAAALADPAGRARGAGRRTPTTGDIGGIGAEARAALDRIGDTLDAANPTTAEPRALDRDPEVGDTVYVTTFAAEGVVRGVSGGRAEIEIRGKRTRVPLASLRRAAPAPSGDAGARGRHGTTARQAPLAPAAVSELVVIGATVDEALARLEKFLDEAILADVKRLRVVHGHGTGRLRDAVRLFLKAHPLVAAVDPAPDHEGGQGATIVGLRDE